MRQSCLSSSRHEPWFFLIPSVERHAPLFERPGTPEKSMSNRYSQ